MLADLDRGDAGLALRHHNLRVVEQPDLQIEIFEFAERDGRKAMVVVGSSGGSVRNGVAQRSRVADETATTAEPSTALGANEGTHDAELGDVSQKFVRWGSVTG